MERLKLIGKTIGFTQLLLTVLVFILLTACQAPPKWTPYEGKPAELYPGEHWQKVSGSPRTISNNS